MVDSNTPKTTKCERTENIKTKQLNECELAEEQVKRICVCALIGKDGNMHALPFYVLDVGKIEKNGDVNTIVPFEYGLL